jgi:hypothetical protein
VELEIAVPRKDDETGPEMGIYDPPHEALKLEEDVCDVEYRQQPAVSVALEIQVFLHAGNFGIANVGAIEEGEKICRGTPSVKHDVYRNLAFFAP